MCVGGNGEKRKKEITYSYGKYHVWMHRKYDIIIMGEKKCKKKCRRDKSLNRNLLQILKPLIDNFINIFIRLTSQFETDFLR